MSTKFEERMRRAEATGKFFVKAQKTKDVWLCVALPIIILISLFFVTYVELTK